MSDQSDKLNYTAAAALLGLVPATLRSLVRRHEIPHLRLGPRLVRFDRATLESWIAERVVPMKATS